MSVNRVNESTGELVTLSSGVRCWIGTKAAHTIAVANHTIPNNVMVCITDDWKNKDDYSTEETDTGKHWIDGKPVYRKTFIYNQDISVDSAVARYVATVIGNVGSLSIDTLVSSSGSYKLKDSPYLFSLPHIDGDLDEGNLLYSRIHFDNDYVYLKIYRNYGSGVYTGITLTIEYTKTTDA